MQVFSFSLHTAPGGRVSCLLIGHVWELLLDLTALYLDSYLPTVCNPPFIQTQLLESSNEGGFLDFSFFHIPLALVESHELCPFCQMSSKEPKGNKNARWQATLYAYLSFLLNIFLQSSLVSLNTNEKRKQILQEKKGQSCRILLFQETVEEIDLWRANVAHGADCGR